MVWKAEDSVRPRRYLAMRSSMKRPRAIPWIMGKISVMRVRSIIALDHSDSFVGCARSSVIALVIARFQCARPFLCTHRNLIKVRGELVISRSTCRRLFQNSSDGFLSFVSSRNATLRGIIEGSELTKGKNYSSHRLKVSGDDTISIIYYRTFTYT